MFITAYRIVYADEGENTVTTEKIIINSDRIRMIHKNPMNDELTDIELDDCDIVTIEADFDKVEKFLSSNCNGCGNRIYYNDTELSI